jgi:hypothetical protein
MWKAAVIFALSALSTDSISYVLCKSVSMHCFFSHHDPYFPSPLNTWLFFIRCWRQWILLCWDFGYFIFP